MADEDRFSALKEALAGKEICAQSRRLLKYALQCIEAELREVETHNVETAVRLARVNGLFKMMRDTVTAELGPDALPDELTEKAPC